MSSYDTHMQGSYQLSDPTVTAVVINPRDPGQIGSSREYGRGPEYSIYSLTEGGLQRIKNCKEKGFHPGCGDGDNYKVIFIRHWCISFLLLLRCNAVAMIIPGSVDLLDVDVDVDAYADVQIL